MTNLTLRLRAAILATTLIFYHTLPAQAAEMAMGFRVGEVTQTSAIIWTRITRDAQRNWNGYREPGKRQPKRRRRSSRWQIRLQWVRLRGV